MGMGTVESVKSFSYTSACVPEHHGVRRMNVPHKMGPWPVGKAVKNSSSSSSSGGCHVFQ